MRVAADEYAAITQPFRSRELSDDTLWLIAKRGLIGQIAAEKWPRLDTSRFEKVCQICTRERRIRFNRKRKAVVTMEISFCHIWKAQMR